ncbi:MAG: DUF4105 domain-containing protein [Planctomycetes bacterium]|nr:DUF4105 domain-containing protein [Planctomycetota bacterium]
MVTLRWFSWSAKVRLVLVTAAVGLSGCASTFRNNVDDMVEPSNNRDWRPDMAMLPYAKIRGDKATIHNIRHCTYIDEHTFVVDHYDKTFDLKDIESVDFILVPFKDTPSLAHTMLSFGFRDGQYLGASVEVRLEKGESYSPVAGSMRQFELMYVIADERDIIQLRTEHRKADVYIYRTRATPKQSRDLFLDVAKRINELKRTPEFYDTFTNNCTTSVVSHFNRVMPGQIPFWDPASILTGYSDRAAYALGFLVDYGSFEETKRRAIINDLAHRHADNPQFSQLIRGELPSTRMAEVANETR